MTEDNIRVLVVDDTVTYRKIVSDVLATIPGIEVVGTAANGKIALTKIDQLRPDMMTLDMEMPDMDGLDVLRQLKQTGSDVGALILSGSSVHDAETTVLALELGAFDFVTKPVGAAPDENVRILREKLRPKIEAFARTSHVRRILRGHEPEQEGTGPICAKHALGRSGKLAASCPPSTNENDVARRMRRIVDTGAGRAEVIAVGISTGGPQALNGMLPQLPADLPVPVLIVQHMPPVFTKSLADDLNRHCALTVSEAVDGQSVLPSHVLIAPGGKQMKVIREGALSTISITDDPPENSCRPSVDYLFRSVARAYGPNAVGVIMTGMGNDGAQGCRQMKQRGAAIIAQDEASCVVYGMPRRPIEEDIADVVAPLGRIAEEITRLVGKGVALCT